MNDSLRRLGLTTLAKAVPGLLETARQQQPTYESFLQQALDTEVQGRAERAQQRRLHAARLPGTQSLDAFDFGFQPTLVPGLIRELATLQFLQTATNVVFLGPPGVGKSHLAAGLARRAIEAGRTVRWVTLRELAEEWTTLTESLHLRRYVSPHLLVIDEIGYVRLTLTQSQRFFDLVAARYERGSMIFTSNRSFTEWGTLLGDEVLATALLDRLLHHAEVITINGRSYRLKERFTPPTT